MLSSKNNKKNTVTQKGFWSRGYFVRTSGTNKDNLKNYRQNQWAKDRRDEGSQCLIKKSLTKFLALVKCEC